MLTRACGRTANAGGGASTPSPRRLNGECITERNGMASLIGHAGIAAAGSSHELRQRLAFPLELLEPALLDELAVREHQHAIEFAGKLRARQRP